MVLCKKDSIIQCLSAVNGYHIAVSAFDYVDHIFFNCSLNIYSLWKLWSHVLRWKDTWPSHVEKNDCVHDMNHKVKDFMLIIWYFAGLHRCICIERSKQQQRQIWLVGWQCFAAFQPLQVIYSQILFIRIY